MIMITYNQEDPPTTITLPAYDDGVVQLLAWPTRHPGLVVVHHRACTSTPRAWGHCFAVCPPVLGDVTAMCFPLKIQAAAFASILAPRAPWATGTLQEIQDALQGLDLDGVWEAGATCGGARHPIHRPAHNEIKEYALV